MQFRKVSSGYRLVVLTVLSGVLLASCGGSRGNDPVVANQASLDETLVRITEKTLVPAVNNFAGAAAQFDATVADYCAAPSEAVLIALQDNWRQLASSWYRVIPYNFGPLNDDVVFPEYIQFDSLRLRGTNYRATVRTQVTQNIQAEYVLDEAYFASQAFQKMGLLALEVLVFETSGLADGETISPAEPTSANINFDYFLYPRKCEMLIGVSQQFTARAEAVQQGWTTQYKNSGSSYAQLFASNNLDAGTDNITVLLTSVQEFLDYLKQRNVVAIAAQSSGYAWTLLEQSIDEVDGLLNGSRTDSFNIFAIMTAAGYTQPVATVRENIAFARASIANKNAIDLGVALALLDGNFKREIPDSLDVELGINFTDGD